MWDQLISNSFFFNNVDFNVLKYHLSFTFHLIRSKTFLSFIWIPSHSPELMFVQTLSLQGVRHILSSVLNITSFSGTNKYKRSQILKYRGISQYSSCLFLFAGSSVSYFTAPANRIEASCVPVGVYYMMCIKGQLLRLIWNTLSCSHPWRPAGQGLHAVQRLLSLRTLCPWPHWYDMCPCACTCIAEWRPGGGAEPESPQQWQLQLWLQSMVPE